ncbi:hypothetical protein G6F43_004868 [Rhizopus delemar]|nr:hypothetical protein G6F43_004868 [Rhizopus delemar]
MSRNIQDSYSNYQPNNTKNEYSTLERGYKKATKKLSRLFNSSTRSDKTLSTTCIPTAIEQQADNQQQSDNHTVKTIQNDANSPQPASGESQEKQLPLTNIPKDEHIEWLTILVNSPLFASTENAQQKSHTHPTSLKTQISRFNDSNQPAINLLQPPSHHQKKIYNNNSSQYSMDEQLAIDNLSKKPPLSSKLQKRDEVKERLELAAAKRNAIKQIRLKEQMDLAWFETMEMMKSRNDYLSSLSNDMLYQKLRMNSGAEASSSKPLFNQQQQPEILIW